MVGKERGASYGGKYVGVLTSIVKVFFFFSSRRRHTILVSDWSSDVCSSDLAIWDPSSNDYAVEANRRYPDRFASLGWFDTTHRQADGFIDNFVAQPGMLGQIGRASCRERV